MGSLFKRLTLTIIFVLIVQNIKVHIHVDINVLRIGCSILVNGSVNLDVMWAASLANH